MGLRPDIALSLIPVWLILLDALGFVLIALGVLGLTGTDFGLPGLVTMAPMFLLMGAVLIAPMLVWIVLKVREIKRTTH